MDEFQSEKEQIDELRQWWKENGNFVVTGILLGVIVLGGWNYWQRYRESQAQSASAVYEQLLQAMQAGNTAAAEDLAGRLAGEYERTPYAAQARLVLARIYATGGDADSAADQLQAVINESKDSYLQHVARLRLARVRLMQDDPDAALAVLGDRAEGEFAALFDDVRGDAHAQRGDAAEARRAWRAALDGAGATLLDRQYVEMKLADLSAAEPGA